MRNQSFTFTDAKTLALFMAVIVREGLTYEVKNGCGNVWTVTLTGGF